jgi:sugar phosphate isomerase/epimerase
MTAPSSWPVALSLPAREDFGTAVRRAVALGYGQVEVAAQAERPLADLEALADAGVLVVSAALGHDLPAGAGLDAADVAVRRAALRHLELQVADAARLGATCAWLPAGTERGEDGLACLAEACALLADFAARRMVRLALAPGPGCPAGWVAGLGQPNLGLSLDAGSEEEARAALCAGPAVFRLCLKGEPERGVRVSDPNEIPFTGIVVAAGAGEPGVSARGCGLPSGG